MIHIRSLEFNFEELSVCIDIRVMYFVQENTSTVYYDIGNVEFETRKLEFEIRKAECVIFK